MTGQRVSDEQLDELENAIGRYALSESELRRVVAELRAALEENRQLQERLEAVRAYVMTVDEENSQRSLTEAPRMISADRIEDLLRGGSSD